MDRRSFSMALADSLATAVALKGRNDCGDGISIISISPFDRPAAGLVPRAHGLPLTAGIGLKPEHARGLLDASPAIGFLEIRAETYMGGGGRDGAAPTRRPYVGSSHPRRDRRRDPALVQRWRHAMTAVHHANSNRETGPIVMITGLAGELGDLLARIPQSIVALLARVSIAAVFWKSGQTKIEGFTVDVVDGSFALGMPRLADSSVMLIREEYKLPLLPPEFAALVATTAEHIFPVLLLVGLATRPSAPALLMMTLVIQFLVYPGAHPTHCVGAVTLHYLMTSGPGALPVDHALAKRYG